MKPLLRTLGVVMLALALMNASAGLCFCARGPVIPGGLPESGGCCHGPEAPGSLVVRAAGSCCHIESAEAAATPAAAIQFAPPAPVVAPLVGAPTAGATAAVVTTVLIGTSPPPSVLRI